MCTASWTRARSLRRPQCDAAFRREQFAKTGINITCYDRDGRIVRRVKSGDTYNAASDDMDETDVAEGNTPTPADNGGQKPNTNPLADE